MKKFKLACLAYAPNPLVFRNIEFDRDQLRLFRKFILGKCSKVILNKEPFRKYGMSTKRIFDDTYL